MKHYTDHQSFSEALLGFVHTARDAGFDAGIQCTKDVVLTSLESLWLEKDLFEFALAALFCQEQEERLTFSSLYSKFWRQKGTVIKDKTTYRNQKKIVAKGNSTAVMMGTGDAELDAESEESKTTTGANSNATLKQTDFSHLSHHQTALLDSLSEKLVREMSLRMKRKRRKAKIGQIDVADSIRKNIQNGGNIIRLSRKHRKKEKFRLLVLLDVSGSMDKYSFYLLKFLWTLRGHFKQIEVFAFSTILMRLTDYISEKDMSLALTLISMNASHWSSGTKIGDSLKDFNDNYAKRYLNGKTVTLVLSDGLDTGEPEVLDEAVKKIKLRSKKLIWLNPLKGMQGYEPIQVGMKTALPSLNHFGSAHNFDSLLELENILSDA